MIHFAVAFALLVHALFWGTGLAVLAMPRPWRRFWPVLVVPAGLALQSAVVWIGAHTDLPGTNSYAWAAELVPAVLLVLAWRRRGLAGLLAEARRLGGVYAAVVGCLFLLVLPLALASAGLTTISLGSCDAADYAGGARVFMEFARGDRTGFIGLTEVVQVQSADNFFDYWRRLNHFTPSALIALNGTILHCAPHELTTLCTILLLAGSLPVVFWIARALVRLPAGASWGVAALYGASPITWYAVGHVAPGQILAAQAMALLAWAGIAMWHRLAAGVPWRRGIEWGGVLVVAYWLVLGSYNFILVVCLVPALAYAGGLALCQVRWMRFARWVGWMTVPLLLAGLFAAGRVAGLAERFRLLRAYDFGWAIPPQSLEGWLGFMGRAPTLVPMDTWLRIAISAAILGLVSLAVVRRRRVAWRIACLALPALVGYAYLQWRAAALGTNASYDAYKLLAVFFPGLLAASLVWISWRPRHRLVWILSQSVAGLVVLAHAISVSQYFHALKSPPLQVTLELRDIRRIEAMPDVSSVNLLLPDMWSRLWANALLLRKEQYFPTHTYEARLNTPLRGEWDLQGGLLATRPLGDGRREITPHFGLVNTRAPGHLRSEIGAGWHLEERAPGTEERWRWTETEATIVVDNPHPRPLKLVGTVDGRSLGERDISLTPQGAVSTAPAVRMNDSRAQTTFAPFTIPPGRSTLVLRSRQPAAASAPGDPRALAVCVFRLELAVVEEEK